MNPTLMNSSNRKKSSGETKYFVGISLIILFLLACSARPSFLQRDPTPTPAGVQFEIQIDPASSLPTPSTPTPLPDLQSAPPLTATATLTPAVLPLLSPTATGDLIRPTLPPLDTAPTATPIPDDPAATPTPAGGTPSGNLYNGDISGLIVPLGPDAAYTVPAGQEQLEFKWEWLGDELRPCQLLEGYGFEIRIWPALDNPFVPAAQQAEIKPLGVIDAVEDQDLIASSCDPRNGIRRFTVNGLSQTPGVALAQGQGQFFWDVAYLQLEPFASAPLMVSMPRDFFIPPAEAPELTPTPLSTATPVFQLTPAPRPEGRVVLVAPADKPTFPANIGPIEFRWRWEGAQAGPCQVGQGYGFELRIGSTQPGFSPLGAFDAKNQGQVACDPGSGVYSHTVLDLKQAEGVKATYMGENPRWDGQFMWDVALVSTNPYQGPGLDDVSPPGFFEISLATYTGAFDPFGEPLSCSEFGSWTEAQAIFLAADPAKDPHKLDEDGDGIVCDELRQ